MKRICISLLAGFLLGGISAYFFLNRKTAVDGVISTTTSFEHNAAEVTNQTVATVKASSKDVSVTTVVNTPYYGDITTTTLIERKAVQYRHEIGTGVAYVDGGLYARVHYGYSGWQTSVYLGYSIYRSQFAFGLGLGYVWRF